MQARSNPNRQDDFSHDESERTPQAKKKWAVAVLLAVLLVALLCQPSDEHPGPATAASVSLSTNGPGHGMQANIEIQGAASALPNSSQFAHTRQLSRISLDDVVASPLFMAERIAPPPVEPRKLTVQAVYGSDRRQSAIVGNSIVRSGQPLPDGRRVLAVTPEGVKLVP